MSLPHRGGPPIEQRLGDPPLCGFSLFVHKGGPLEQKLLKLGDLQKLLVLCSCHFCKKKVKKRVFRKLCPDICDFVKKRKNNKIPLLWCFFSGPKPKKAVPNLTETSIFGRFLRFEKKNLKGGPLIAFLRCNMRGTPPLIWTTNENLAFL